MKEIKLTQGKVALVDDDDFDRVSQFKWHAHFERRRWYAEKRRPWVDGKPDGGTRLHRFIMPGFDEIDHADGNGLNNQKYNLRPATRTQNNANQRKQLGCSSEFKGVTWRKDLQIWMAQIQVTKTHIYLGVYDSEEDAAHVYDYAAKIYFGEFAKTNFK